MEIFKATQPAKAVLSNALDTVWVVTLGKLAQLVERIICDAEDCWRNGYVLRLVQ